MTAFEARPIGVVRSPRTDPADTEGWGDVTATVELVPELGDDSLTGLAEYSHVEIVFWFDQVVRRDSYSGLARPRGREDMPLVGVFAARGPNRPNPIGVSVCPIVEVGAHTLTVRGLDAVDGTPVLDLKAVMRRFLPADVTEPEWSGRLLARYYER